MSMLGLNNDGEGSGYSVSPEEIKAVSRQATPILIGSAISILFCCLGGFIATYFAYQGQQDANSGNIEGARHNIKMATGWMIATYVIGILSVIGRLASSL